MVPFGPKECCKISSTHASKIQRRARTTLASFKFAVVDGTLPCKTKLPWLTPLVLSTITDNFRVGGPNGFAALGPFYWRLSRCSDSDVAQLNYHYKTQFNWSFMPPAAFDYTDALYIFITYVGAYNPASSMTCLHPFTSFGRGKPRTYLSNWQRYPHKSKYLGKFWNFNLRWFRIAVIGIYVAVRHTASQHPEDAPMPRGIKCLR